MVAAPPCSSTARTLHFNQAWRAGAYAGALLAINIYISHGFFSGVTAYMNSIHGFWMALARWGGGSWLHPSWWPYWGAGMPMEFTYQPLIPRWIALWDAWGGISFGAALERITGIVYCLGPETMFVMAWLATRAPGYSFLAGAIYSLSSLADGIVPDPLFTGLDAHRLYLMAVWDDLPHLTALALLPLAIIAMYFYVRRGRWIYFAG